MKPDWLFAFLAGVFAMAGVAYLLWRMEEKPPDA